MGFSDLGELGELAGIGGIAIGAMLLILRPLIKKMGLSKLGPTKTYRTLRLLIILSWSIGLAGIAASIIHDYSFDRTYGSYSPIFKKNRGDIYIDNTSEPSNDR